MHKSIKRKFINLFNFCYNINKQVGYTLNETFKPNIDNDVLDLDKRSI